MGYARMSLLVVHAILGVGRWRVASKLVVRLKLSSMRAIGCFVRVERRQVRARSRAGWMVVICAVRLNQRSRAVVLAHEAGRVQSRMTRAGERAAMTRRNGWLDLDAATSWCVEEAWTR